MHTALAVFRPLRSRRRRPFGVGVGLLCLVVGCHDRLTAPSVDPLAPPRAMADVLDSPSTGSVELSVSGEAPLAGNQQLVGHFPTPTVVAMTVHQDFAITTLPPHPPENGRLGLAGRVYAFGCSHQGEAYLLEYPDDGGYGYPFAGCQLAGQPGVVTSLSDTVLVSGMVYYGYGFDAACPYPDAACASYTGSSGVSLVRPSATLAIGGDSVRAGVLRAFPKREYTLVATPTPDRMGRYQTPVLPVGTGWSFRTDSGVVTNGYCTNGSARVCTATFTKSGYLTLHAVVNGEEMSSAPLRVQLPEVKLSLSAYSVSVGDTVLATTTVAGIEPSALTYYYVSVFGSGGVPLPGTGSGVSAAGVPACIGTKPIPLRCFVVFTKAGKAQVEVGAILDLRRGIGAYDNKPVVVQEAATRRVKLAVVDAGIRPTARYWRYDPKRHAYTPHPSRLPDTSRTILTVSVVDAAGVPVPNADVTLGLTAHDSTAGHLHRGGKPTGILQTLQREAVPESKVNTGSTGVTRLYFVASEISGPVTISGTSPRATTDTARVSVRVPGLVAMATGAHYTFVGAVEGRHVANHYGTPAALAAFSQFADSLNEWINEPLGINDISLPQGGLFDVGGTSWDIPHGYHRQGTHADIRNKTGAGVRFTLARERDMQDLWENTLDHGTLVHEGDHIHLNFYAP